ncbi:MAG: ATP phosphoribosyltransferase regulatory subunit, partial [Acidiferrobacterales bacterium]
LRLLLKLSPDNKNDRGGILAPHDGDTALQIEVTRLRSAGERVVMRLPGSTATAKEAGCDRELVHEGGKWTVVVVGPET